MQALRAAKAASSLETAGHWPAMPRDDYWRETFSKKHEKKFNDTQKVKNLLARNQSTN